MDHGVKSVLFTVTNDSGVRKLQFSDTHNRFPT